MMTLQLARDGWDILLDASGRLLLTEGSYAIAQKVANEVRMFTRDAYFAQQDGIPHFGVELGHMPNTAVLRDRINKAARAVAGVATAKTTLNALDGRTLTGVITITTTNGETLDVAF